jgi:hypothetical protein
LSQPGLRRDRGGCVSLPELIARLNGQPPAERFDAALALGKMGRKARKAVPALIETLKDTDKNVRKAAALALADIGPDAREAVPALCEVVLHDDEAAVRRRDRPQRQPVVHRRRRQDVPGDRQLREAPLEIGSCRRPPLPGLDISNCPHMLSR